MAMKLDGLSPRDLEALINDAQSRMAAAKSAQIDSARNKINAILKAESLQLSDVFPGRGGKPGKRKGAGIPKYRNPADHSQTWTGHGMKPKWFVTAIKKPGVTEASLLIAHSPAKKAPAKAVKKAAPKKKAAVAKK